MRPPPIDPVRPPLPLALPGGLRGRLIALPPGSRAAALLRVGAGSHDEPAEYPGLAHFLEHLLFLGSRAYPQARSLMAFVRGCGGQLNASTRERHTDFFFEVPADLLGEALGRLLDMLARPLLDIDAQLAEREVLQAEFQARAAERETLCDAALGSALAAPHPFGAFHAGNRATLPVERPAFQRALREHHRRFYQAGQSELLLAAPQRPAALADLLRATGCRLARAPRVERRPPPLGLTAGRWLRLQSDGRPRQELAFAVERLPAGGEAALDLLADRLTGEAPGGLASRLREAGWCEAIDLRTPYRFAGQGLVAIGLELTETGLSARAALVEAVCDWLRFFAEAADWHRCWDEYRRSRQRQLSCLGPLARVRYWAEPGAWSATTAEASVRQALSALLGQMRRQRPLVLTCDRRPCEPRQAGGFPLHLDAEAPPRAEPRRWRWRQPEPNPWLRPAPAALPAVAIDPALRFLEQGDTPGPGALFLRWRLAETPPGLWRALGAALRPTHWAARQAGVELHFEDGEGGWSLQLHGPTDLLPQVLEAFAGLLRAPPRRALAEALRRQADEADDGGEMPIRRLLRRLPRFWTAESAAASGPQDLARAWHGARWDGLAAGLPAASSGRLQAALARLPGQPARGDRAGLAPGAGLRWWQAGDSGESALLLFCPLPASAPATEAAWRLLAQLMEGAFYRRLRSELQLGYAVSCGFRQVGGRSGILFAVQSSSASVGQLLAHVEAFLDERQAWLQALEAAPLAEERARVAARLADAAGNPRELAEWAWQARLAGRGTGHPERVRAALERLRRDEAARQLAALRTAAGGWCALANAPPPPGWRRR